MQRWGKREAGTARQAPVLTPIPTWQRDLPPVSAAPLSACCPHSSTRAERWWHRCHPQCRAHSHLLPPPGHGAARQRGCGAGRREEEDEDEQGSSFGRRGSAASWVGEKAPRWAPAEGLWGLWNWQHPQHPSHFPAPAEGDGMCWEDGCSTATGSIGASTAVPGEQPGPAGAARMGSGGHAGRIAPRINPLSPPYRSALGVSQTCAKRCTRHSPQQGQVALGGHPRPWGTPNLHIGAGSQASTVWPQPLYEAPWARAEAEGSPFSPYPVPQDPPVLWGMAQP